MGGVSEALEALRPGAEVHSSDGVHVGWLKAALQDPDVKAKLALQGLYPVGMCGDEFAAYVRKRFDDYGEMIKESNIKAQ